MNRTRWLLVVCAVPLLLVFGVLVSAGLESGGGGSDGPGFTPEGAERVDVGRGATGAAIFRPSERDGGGPVVILLHGWAAVDPSFYGPWIDHLVRRGTTVIYPTYQEEPFVDPLTPLPNVLAALGLAFEELGGAPTRLVVAGHSAGGALAVDYAASARSAGMPAPSAVFSVYPGRSIGGDPVQLKPVDAAGIAADTRVLVLGGARDQLVGTRFAREIARTTAHARTTLRIVRDRGVDDHAGPARSSPEARRAFWKPLDRLVDATG